jgi:hypothetical protein
VTVNPGSEQRAETPLPYTLTGTLTGHNAAYAAIFEKHMTHPFKRRSLVQSKSNRELTMWVADNNEDGSWGTDQVNCEWRDAQGQLQTKLFPVTEIEDLPNASR